MIEQLMQIDRSITGDGVRRSLEILKQKADFDIHEIPSGTQVFDWTVPQEWVIRDAVLSDESGKVWADYKKDFLHVVSYSEPIDKHMEMDELKIHLHTHPVTGAIPYRTSYYKRDWGFCLAREEKDKIRPHGLYHAFIDSEFKDGSMTYGEKVIEGDETEYIISTYCCHPSMVNDNAAGMAMWADLLAGMPEHTKHTYRFIIAPETIGMIAYLATHDVSKVKGAVILSHVVGKDGTEPPTFKQSYLGNSYMDRIARQVVTRGHEQRFSIRGGDERQLSSPAFRIPTILLNKAGLYGTYYHTSLDREYNLTDYNATLHAAREMVYLLEHDKTVDSLNPHAEPMMGKRNLYSNLGGDNQKDKDVETLMWTMFYSDSSLLDIAEKTRIPMQDVIKAAETLERNKLIK